MTSSSHGNLVGDIELKNKINDKVYIGQAKDVHSRWIYHKTAAKTGHYKHRCLLYEAMQKYGIHNFYYEILERQVPNYNEREKYWIAFYNSVAPNGYNLLEGGEQYPNLRGVMNAMSAIQSKDVLDSVIADLKSSNLRLTEIAKKYDVPLNTIHGINSGATYYDSSLLYPIRSEPIPFKLSKKDVRDIIWFLQGNEYRINDIARIYGVSEVTINCINVGNTHTNIYPSLERPIRQEKVVKSSVLSDDQVTDIIWMLQNTSKSLREIARKYGVAHNVIISIKNGSKLYKRKGLTYPLRPNN